ncbi:MAG: transketolase [Lautropia sp.]|nr:transketolase [Lautropia sp.]
MAHAIRFLAVDAIIKATEGHQGVPLGMAEIATALYADHLKHDPSDPCWWDRDRVVLSNGHGSMLLYSLLYLSGYERISLEQIKTFRELGSHCAGHPEFDPAAGIEVTTGPLGQGIANAMGMAIAEAFLRARFGADLIDHHTYAFVGDGCLQEGIGQEMASLAGHLKLGRLILLWDDNQITDDGSTTLSISENVPERFRVAGWHVVEVDGHDITAVSGAIAEAKADPRPSFIACKTIIARGIARLQGQRGGHSAPLLADDAVQMRKDLDWNHAPFEVPDEVLNAWRDASWRGRTEHDDWKARVAQLPPEKRQEFERVMRGELPAGWKESLQSLEHKLLSGNPVGGINLSAAINDCLTDILPERMVACADLEAPTGHKRRLDAFNASNPGGAYIHCGVREHVMGALCNGMAAHGGIVPVSVTYLAFSDYLRPAMRMAALMGLPVKFVFSHDSIGIGKNGPTHQPVEVLASLRAMPNMLVMRPADAVEAVECWEAALQHRSGPVTFALSRQALPPVNSAARTENRSARGAYVLAEAGGGVPSRQVTLLATGSEVAIALQARDELQHHGIATAVVSMPCWELFEQQTPEYQEQVLCPGTITVAVEAAVQQGWERWLGSNGGFVGMRSFGASGPADALYRHFGITAEAVVKTVRQRLDD